MRGFDGVLRSVVVNVRPMKREAGGVHHEIEQGSSILSFT